MQVTINITDEELEKLLKATGEDTQLHNVHWQLRGHWMTGGDVEHEPLPNPELL